MLKYLEHEITFREIPDEVTLCINISGCPNHCPNCHSKHLWEDVGNDLTKESLDSLISPYKTGISCVCFMGGDQDAKEIDSLVAYVKTKYSNIKTAWYSGKSELSNEIRLNNFDYIKLGPYIEEYGPLDKPITNQRLYKVIDKELIDITNKFWQ